MCPHKLLNMCLVQFIKDSIESGLEVILTVNANEHMVKEKLASAPQFRTSRILLQ